MRRSLLLLLSALPLALAAACSSDDSSSTPSGAYEPAGNGVPISESAACDGLKNAYSNRRSALACGPFTQPACPGFLQKQKQTPACSQYDQGALGACVDYVSKLSSCDELASKDCIVKPLANTAPNGCAPVIDAGFDAGQDAGEDAGEDAAEDAAEDVVIDVTADVTPDAPDLDAGDDGAADAASD